MHNTWSNSALFTSPASVGHGRQTSDAAVVARCTQLTFGAVGQTSPGTEGAHWAALGGYAPFWAELTSWTDIPSGTVSRRGDVRSLGAIVSSSTRSRWFDVSFRWEVIVCFVNTCRILTVDTLPMLFSHLSIQMKCIVFVIGIHY